MNKKQLKYFETMAEEIRLYFGGKDESRERVLQVTRDMIRFSAKIIRCIHRREFFEAKNLLKSAEAINKELNNLSTTKDVDLYYSGFVHDAQKEFAEANITLALVSGKQPPKPQTISVEYAAYLHGLGETVGEVRRFILDSLRQDDLSRVEELLSAMDEIYSILITMDFPDAITHGIRRITDNVRGILEKTRGDLTIALKQKELEKKIDYLQE
jgi:translin